MALLATIVMLPIGVVFAWVLARHRFTGRTIIETALSLPLVMPPVATGLILLKLFTSRGPVGRVLEAVGIEVIFTWKAVVLAMAVMGLPLLVRSARTGFEQIDIRYEQIAATLGAGPARVFFTISLPFSKAQCSNRRGPCFRPSAGRIWRHRYDRRQYSWDAYTCGSYLQLYRDWAGCRSCRFVGLVGSGCFCCAARR